MTALAPWLFSMTEGEPDRERPAADVGKSRRRRRGHGSSRYPLARFLAASGCLGLWAAAYLRNILIDSGYQPPAGILPISLAAAGYLFGTGLKGLRNRDKDDE